jgi:hypothetical protein
VKTCGPKCNSLCDFCIHMDHSDREAGEGMCAVFGEIKGWSEGENCESFECFRIESCAEVSP